MRLQDLNWMDIERYLERDSRIILVTGATEQHAYLSLMTDILIPKRIAEAIAKRENVLVAPALNFGVSRYFLEFPGTISFSQHTFDFALMEIIESLLHQGFRRFFIMNGHGGNKIPERLFDFQMEGIIRVSWYDWWRSQAATNFAARHGLSIQHANWGENFPFNRVAESPNQDKPIINTTYGEEYFSLREVLGDGSYGGPYQVDDALMYMLFDEIVEEAASLLHELAENIHEEQ